MNKISFEANPDTNYVFHMLSVAGCGYDNAYGQKYRDRYAAEDLQILKDNEDLLTICGGKHNGALYFLQVILPARAEQPCDRFYTMLLNTKEKDIIKQYRPYKERVYAVSRIMVKYYHDFLANIWPEEQKRINDYIQMTHHRFEESSFTEQAEQIVGVKLPVETFVASMVPSVQDGAEAIDISDHQDVFGIEHSVEDSFFFIGHEFIIYLLKEALRTEDAFLSNDTWPLTEGLAEYYLKKIMGGTRFFHEQQHIVAIYERLEHVGLQTAAGLYRAAYNEMKT